MATGEEDTAAEASSFFLRSEGLPLEASGEGVLGPVESVESDSAEEPSSSSDSDIFTLNAVCGLWGSAS